MGTPYHSYAYRASLSDTSSETTSSSFHPVQSYLEQYYDDYEKTRYERYPHDHQYQLPPSYAHSSLPDRQPMPASPPVIQPINGTTRQRPKRIWYFVGCFMLTIVVILITLGVLYLKQRQVSFTILPISINDTIINMNPDGFLIPIDPIIQAHNDNFFDVKLNTISVQALHSNYANGMSPLANGSLSNVLLKHREDTTFIFPLLFTYNSTLDPSYIYFEKLLTNCSDPTNAQLHIQVDINVDYSVWAKSGTMQDNRDLMVPCPIDVEKATRILQIVHGM